MANSIEQWAQVSKEAGTWLWEELRRLPAALTSLVAAAGMTVMAAGEGHLLYDGADRLLSDE
jgi:hypothetical protein